MRGISFEAIYVLWLRELKAFIRARSRIVGNIVQPLFFMAILGVGFKSSMRFTGVGMQGIDYLQFLVPGLIGMTILFSSMFAGLSILWDRQFGFLREIMVAPVSRLSLVLGRVAGGMTTTILQALSILLIAYLFGFRIKGIMELLLSIIFMILIGTGFVGMGVAFASKMEDMHGFQIVMNFIIMPIFFLSGALFPLKGLPPWLGFLTYIDPLTYGVDALRGIMLNISYFPLAIDFVILAIFCVTMLFTGAVFFSQCEV
ncbi:ABC transporter permease [Candidatus Aerophobetes bacterium]|nr:ABC transporter permease [Candidatus Aerophobetes bacterium]